MTAGNPFLEAWTTPFEAPPFDRIEPEHFRPAFEAGMSEQNAEIAAIAGSPEEPTFANTLEALERSGRTLRRVGAVFFNLAGAHTSDAIQAVEREMAPLLTRHRNGIFMNEALFARVSRLHEARDRLGLSPEQARVLERYHTIFTRAGAGLGPRRQGAARRHHGAARDAGHPLLAERARGRAGLHPRPGGRGRPRRPAGLPGPGGGSGRRRARARGALRDHPVALLHRALPHLLPPPRPARARLPGLGVPGRGRGRDGQPGRHRRDGAAARRAGAAPGPQDLRPLQARRHDGPHAGGGGRPAPPGLGARPRPGRPASGTPSRPSPVGRATTSRSRPTTGATTRSACAGRSTTSTRRS
jgi:hypothetical protein